MTVTVDSDSDSRELTAFLFPSNNQSNNMNIMNDIRSLSSHETLTLSNIHTPQCKAACLLAAVWYDEVMEIPLKDEMTIESELYIINDWRHECCVYNLLLLLETKQSGGGSGWRMRE